LIGRAMKGGSDPAFFSPALGAAPDGPVRPISAKAKKLFEISLMLA